MRPKLFLYWGGSMAASFMFPLIAGARHEHGAVVAFPMLALGAAVVLAAHRMFRSVLPVPEPLAWAGYEQLLADATDLLDKLRDLDAGRLPGTARIAHGRALQLAAGVRPGTRPHDLVRAALAHLQAAARLSNVHQHSVRGLESRLWPWEDGMPELEASEHLVHAGAWIAAALDRDVLAASAGRLEPVRHETTTTLRPRQAA